MLELMKCSALEIYLNLCHAVATHGHSTSSIESVVQWLKHVDPHDLLLKRVNTAASTIDQMENYYEWICIVFF
jgi:hypothetical protein